jgi:antirestriction protein ArdC
MGNAENARAKVEQAQASILDAVEALTGSEDWAQWLAFTAKFHRYSVGNQFLIWAQCPDASHVAGYRRWQSLGRQVRKGEKGLTILAPRTGDCKACEAVGCERCRGKGRYLSFTTATVFDVSQTEGDELPASPVSASLIEGEDEAGIFAVLVDRLLPAGWSVEIGDSGAANGWCSHERRLIMVGERLGGLQRVKTLVHELAHAVLHGDVDYVGNRERCEVEAESVAYVVLSVLGVDSSGYSFGYVAGWSGGDVAVVRAAAGVVGKTATQFVDALLVGAPELVGV